MDIEENDEIERELDIVYSGQFSNETKIFQFPLIPKSSLNIKNINSLETSKDMNSIKIKMNIEQKYLDKNNYNAVPNHTLKGEKIEYNTNLCLGLIKNNKLILTPISQIFQFRHDFSGVNKEKTVEIKKDIKSFDLKKELKEDVKYNSTLIHQPDSINSKIILERMAALEGELNQANYMSKNEYLDLLLKDVITPDSSGDPNDDYLYLSKNNSSKESFFQNSNDIFNKGDNMVIETEEKENKKNKKGRGFSSGLDAIKNSSDKKANKGGNGIVHQIIINLFGDNDCLFYDNLLNDICQKMNISNNDEDKINQIKNEIEESCILVQQNICFVKDIDDYDIKDARNLIIREVGNNENGLKKQQIKKLIEQNGLKISDSKLTKLLQKICKFSGSCWTIKTPTN